MQSGYQSTYSCAVTTWIACTIYEKPFSSLCRSEPVLSRNFCCLPHLMEENSVRTGFCRRNFCCSPHPPTLSSSQQIIPHQMRRKTKYPPTVWTPTEFSSTNEEKVYCNLWPYYRFTLNKKSISCVSCRFPLLMLCSTLSDSLSNINIYPLVIVCTLAPL